MTHLSHLECGWCSAEVPADALATTCPEDGRPLLARYDLDAVAETSDRATFERGRLDLWRFEPFLPLSSDEAVSLGEGMTPILAAPRLGNELGLETLYVKDEGSNPTGTFKARGMTTAVSRALSLGAERFTVPTAGNAGVALAAYGARAGTPVRIFAPSDAAPAVFDAADTYGAQVEKVDGLITDAGARARALVESEPGWFDISTLKEPYRLEGKKTMGLELALQFGWELPDVVVYPTGGGTGLIGMWKAFNELEQIGWIGSERPRLVSVQPTGCKPMVDAFHWGDETATPAEDPQTVAGGLRVPSAVGDFLILRALRETDGTAVAVSDEVILAAKQRVARTEGISACTEAAATLAGLERLVDDGWVEADERVVLFNTGAGWTG